MNRLSALLIALLLVLSACSSSSSMAVGDSSHTDLSDSVALPDLQQDSSSADGLKADMQPAPDLADAPPQVGELQVVVAGRGPIRVESVIVDPEQQPLTVELLWKSTAGSWKTATLFPHSEEWNGSTYSVVWNSVADSPLDGAVQLRLLVSDGSNTIQKQSAPIQLSNGPDNTRAVVLTHSITTADVDARRITVLKLDPAGVMSTTGQNREVVEDPTRVVFHPGAEFAYVLGRLNGKSAISLVRLNGTQIVEIKNLELPTSNVGDLDISFDAQRIFLTSGGTTEGTRGVAIYRLGLNGEIGGFLRRIDVNNPSNITLFPDNTRMFVNAGVLNQPYPFALIFDHLGAQHWKTEQDLGSSVYGPALSADGKMVVLPSDDLFEPRLHFLTVDGVAASVVESATYGPQVDALFVRNRVLISRLDQNRVSVWTPTDKGLTAETHVAGIPLAASMDVLRRGKRAGLVLVSSIRRVFGLVVASDGSVKKNGHDIELPPGTINFIEDLAIQP